MKSFRQLLILLIFSLPLCGTAQEFSFNCRIIPTPQKVERTQGVFIMPQNYYDIACDTVKSIAGAPQQQEAYQLVITPKGAKLYAATAQGAENGKKTFQHLAMLWGHQIPCMEITDWPAYEWRGFLDDISRGPIPSESFRNEQYRRLYLAFKLNFANYYTEHALYNPTYPDIVPTDFHSNWSSPQAWLRMANLQCFAHFEKTLRIPYYKNIMDTPTNVNPSKEETYEFLRAQIQNTLKAYYHWTPFFNINCDETEGLGSGRARRYVDEVGADEAYCRHINRVFDIIQECSNQRNDSLKGAKPEVLMWGDIVGKNPEMLRKLPKEMNYIIWSYAAQESYADMIAPFAKLHQEQGTRFWVAPGVSHWSSIPQVHNYMQNIAYLARDGYLAGARGLMNTAWDDSGESLFGDCWHAMAWGAEMAWNPIRSTDPAAARQELAERERMFNENYNRWMSIQSHRKEAAFTSEMIYHVGDLAGNKWVGDWYNTSALMQPLLEFYPSNVSDEMLQRCDSVDNIISQVMKHIDSATVPHFYYGCHRILRVSEKSRLRVMLHRGDPDAARCAQQYFRHLHQLKLEYLRLWDEECTGYSRDIICERYDHLGNEVLELNRKVLIETSGDTVALRTLLGSQSIYYTLDGRQPSTGSMQYSGPFVIDHNCLIKTACYNEWDEPVFSERYLLHHAGMGHLAKLNTSYSSYNATYSAGGDNALADGCLGSDNSYADGHWQGYWGEDIDAVYDFGKSTAVNSICMRFLQCSVNWVLAPQTIEVYTSDNGKDWKLAHTARLNPDFRDVGYKVRTNTLRNLDLSTRHLRVVAKNPGPLPQWHGSKGQPSYLFCDEIVIE